MAEGADLDWDVEARRCSRSRCLDSVCERRGQRSNNKKSYCLHFNKSLLRLQIATILTSMYSVNYFFDYSPEITQAKLNCMLNSVWGKMVFNINTNMSFLYKICKYVCLYIYSNGSSLKAAFLFF